MAWNVCIPPAVEVVIPHGRDDDPERVAVREWVVARYRREHPDWHVTLAPCPTSEWSKGAAANPVIFASTADVILLADADSYVHPRILTGATDGALEHGWAVPHTRVKRITQRDTARILTGEQVPRPVVMRETKAMPGGGIVAATPHAWATVHGVDPRFMGWGGEDFALGSAMRLLAGVPWTPPDTTLWHLWHPFTRRPTKATTDLWRRYRKARRNTAEMAAIVKEWGL